MTTEQDDAERRLAMLESRLQVTLVRARPRDPLREQVERRLAALEARVAVLEARRRKP